MDKSEIDKLLKPASREERIRLTTLFNASVENLKRYQTTQTKNVLLDLEAADRALAEYVNRIKAKYFQEAIDVKLISKLPNSIRVDIQSHPDPDARARLSTVFVKLRGSVFAGVMDVVRHLQRRGFKVGKSKVFGDAAKGLLLVQEDKSVFQVDVEEYIIKSNLKLKAADDKAALEDNYAQIKEEEIRGHKLKNEKLEIELKKIKGEIIDSKEAETEKAINLGAFDAAIRHLVRTESHNWILRAGHDPKKLIDIINADMDEMCNDLASRKEITVEVAHAAAAA